RCTLATGPGSNRTTSWPEGWASVIGTGSASGPTISAAIVPGVTHAVAIATAPVTASALWQSCGMKYRVFNVASIAGAIRTGFGITIAAEFGKPIRRP